MSILSNRQPKAKRQQKQRTFSIVFRIDGTEYMVGRIPAHPEVARVAYSVRKLTEDGETYHVRISPEGWVSCDCKGHERWGHCKHADTIKAAAGVFDLTAPLATPQTAECA
jgi:hypothetical protein